MSRIIYTIVIPADTAFDLFGNGLSKKHAPPVPKPRPAAEVFRGRYPINGGIEGSPPRNPTRIGIGMTEDEAYGAVGL